jgi:hypothetical protein
MKKITTLLIFLVSMTAFCQDEDYSRLKAINNKGVVFYNVDGVEFSSQTLDSGFSEKGLKKAYKKYSIKDDDVKAKDDLLPFNNICVTKTETVAGIKQINSYYFVEDHNTAIVAIWFGYFGKPDNDFERRYVTRIVKEKIPKDVFEPTVIGTIDFAGRELALGNACYWTNVNTVQCPYSGELNWSVHKTMESATAAIDNQAKITKSKKGGKVVSEEEVDVIFEGTETKAKKVVYDFTGIKSVLAGMSGGKTLTIYYVADKVRDNYVSCCMSFWNNDTITESGLAPLLEEVMQLKR